MMQQTIDFRAARARRERGMRDSEAHADRESPGWPERAYGLLCRYAREQAHPWTCESFRWWAAANGLDDPPDSRAFGGVTQRALRKGVILKVGYAPAASSNGSVKPLYSRPVLGVAA